MSGGSIAELLVARAGDDGGGLIFEDQTWSWRDVVEESAARGKTFERLGVAGGHIGVLLDNVPEYVFLLGAAALTGSVIVGINHTRRGEALAGDIRHTDCAVVLTDATKADLVKGLDVGAPVVLVDEQRWVDHIAACRDAGLPEHIPGPDALLLLIFTSGSTGAPKAVRMTQGRAVAQMAGAARGLPTRGCPVLVDAVVPRERAVREPVSRVECRSDRGAQATVLRLGLPPRCPEAPVHVVQLRRPVARLHPRPPATDLDADNDLVFCIGAEASPRDRKEFRRRFGCFVAEGYTSSEGGLAINPFRGMPEEALGRAPEGMDVAIVDPESGVERPRARFGPTRELLNADEAIGEIVRRDEGGSFEGYYANDEADARRTRNGWIWTGDLGYRDDDGIFYFAGRGNDWLRVDGENFAAGPVEAILGRHPDVVSAVGLRRARSRRSATGSWPRCSSAPAPPSTRTTSRPSSRPRPTSGRSGHRTSFASPTRSR